MIAHQVARVRHDSSHDSSSDALLALRDTLLREAPVSRVPLAELCVSFTPRTAGVDGAWALTLAELDSALPPILVHRPTMNVIDGVHRLRAARLRGRADIEVRFFDGCAQDAALLAVAVNVAQGRPLSSADRVAAAQRIITARPHWSDRAIAAVAGLSAKKVGELRLHTGDLPPCERRIGLDGRTRPLNSAQGRERAGQLLRADPSASLRTIARQAGISPATVADVRDRLLRGDDPVLPRRRARPAREAPARPEPEGTAAAGGAARSPGELAQIFESLRRDPSLRLNEVGRSILRMLDACALVARDRRQIIANLPPHCTGQMAELVAGYADLWQLLAEDLRAGEQRARPPHEDRTPAPAGRPW